MFLSLTQVVNGAGDQFLSAARLSLNKNRRVCWCHSFHLSENLMKNGAIPNNLLKVHFRPKFVFKIEFLLSEFILQFCNLRVSKSVIDSDSDLTSDLG